MTIRRNVKKQHNDYCKVNIKWLLVVVVFLALQPTVVVFSQRGSGLLASSFSRFPDHTQRRAPVGRTSLDELSIRRRVLYLTTHNTHNTNIHALGGIRTHNLSRRAAEDLRLRPRGRWDRRTERMYGMKIIKN